MDARPNDHDRPGLSRDLPCVNCGHPTHPFTRCGDPIDAAMTVTCPCSRVPVPGIYA